MNISRLFGNRNVAFSKKISFNKKVCLLDIGARDGIGWPWCTAPNNALDIILVEPDPIEAKVLEDQNQARVLSYALWSEEAELTLNINNSPGTSSVLKPNMPFLLQFEDAQHGESFKTTFEYTIAGVTADKVVELFSAPMPDYIKIDVDGIEHLILEGCENILKTVNSVLVEINDNFKEQANESKKYLLQAGLVLEGKFDLGVENQYN